MFNYTVKISWELGQDTDEWWNEVCAWALEEFGLPGNRFITQPTVKFMCFSFKDKEDAALMSLRWGKNNE